MDSTASASQSFLLFEFITNQPPGVGFTMDQMKEAIDTDSDQVVRQLLTALRQGRVPDPAHRGQRLRQLPVNYDRETRAYYNFETTTADNVEDGVTASILLSRLADLLSRAESLRLAAGDEGIGKAITDQILSNVAARQLLGQIPIPQIQEARRTIDAIFDARWMLVQENILAGETPLLLDTDEQTAGNKQRLGDSEEE